MQYTMQLKKSAIDATTVTLVPSTAMPSGQRGEAGISQIVVTTGDGVAGVPPPGFWGVAAADGMEYLLILRKRT